MAAESLGMGSRIGTIAPGFEADLVAVEGNPLEDIHRGAARGVRDEGRQGLPKCRACGAEVEWHEEIHT